MLCKIKRGLFAFSQAYENQTTGTAANNRENINPLPMPDISVSPLLLLIQQGPYVASDMYASRLFHLLTGARKCSAQNRISMPITLRK